MTGPTRKRWGIATVAVLMAAATLVTATATRVEAATVSSRFSDDDWSIHEPNINAIGAIGITKGCNPPTNTAFCPDRAVTRSEMAAFLKRGFGLPAGGPSGFTDIDGSIFTGDIEAIAAAGITKGCNPPANNLFCPDRAVTRAEMASFLTRALDLKPRVDGPFDDIAGSVHAGDINAIAAIGVTKGCNPPANTRFCPDQPVTRAQMASFMARALGLDPILSVVKINRAVTCARDQRYCSSSMTIPSGRAFRVDEGWFNVLPFIADEEAAFSASGTTFTLLVDGVTVPTTSRSTSTATRATRRWTGIVSGLDPGEHTVRGIWRWDGDTTRTVDLRITTP